MKEKEIIETLLPIKYSTNLAFIAKLSEKYLPLEITDLDDKEQFEAVHDARMVMVKVRTTIEKERVEQKAAAIKYGKEVDADAKVLFEASEPTEAHLKAQEDKVINEKKRIEAEEREKFTLMVNGRVASLLKYGEVLPFDVVAGMTDAEYDIILNDAVTDYDIEETRKAEEEAERIARQAELDRKQGEQDKRDRTLQDKEDALKRQSDAIEKEKRDMEEKKNREAFEKQAIENARIQAEKDAAAKVEREKREAEREAEEKAALEQLQADIAARKAALLPDKEKLIAWAEAVEKAVPVSVELTSKEAKGIFIDAVEVIEDIVEQVKKKARDM